MSQQENTHKSKNGIAISNVFVGNRPIFDEFINC